MGEPRNALSREHFNYGGGGGPYADRQPYPSERSYFAANPRVAGMAAEDDRVVINAFAGLSRGEYESVRRNELARILMRTNPAYAPSFNLTPEQSGNLQGTTYAGAPEDARMATIAARLYSGDPSGGSATPEQQQLMERLRIYFGVYGAPFSTQGRR